MKKLIPIGIPFVVAFVGALFTEYVLQIGVLGTNNLKFFLLAGVAAAGAAYFLARRTSYAVATFIGVLLIPYVVFGIGQIDIYMVDDNLAQGMTVVEVRPTMNAITFGTPDKGSVPVWKGPMTLRLHPGENRVKLGRFAMPAGAYAGGQVSLGNIEVDLIADLSAMVDPTSGQAIPEDHYVEAFEAIKNAMAGTAGGFPIRLENASLSGSIGSFTINVGSMQMPIPVPSFSYPGMGGPDITVDIVLDDMGRPDPSKIRTIVDMPPGVGGAFPEMPGVIFN